jgi:hypothetical protein
MSRTRILTNSSAVLVVIALAGCGKEKAEALAEIEKIKSACASGERQKATAIMLAAADKNESFGKAFRNVTAEVPDKSVVDACGAVPDKVKKHLEEQ